MSAAELYVNAAKSPALLHIHCAAGEKFGGAMPASACRHPTRLWEPQATPFHPDQASDVHDYRHTKRQRQHVLKSMGGADQAGLYLLY